MASIEEIITLHPDVGPALYNETLGRAVARMIECAAICNACADACIAEPMDMTQCIRLCLDCSDVCSATGRVGSRRSGGDRQLIRTLLATCIEACERTADECAMHEHEHCQLCALMCKSCAEDCRLALKVLNEEAHEAGDHLRDVMPPSAASPAS
jgi:hypothetical protein